MSQKIINKKSFYLLSFLIPVIVWIFICVLQGIFPFGSKSIMTGDITYQFIDYLAYFKSVILGNNDFTYTFSKTMGGDMIGFSSYYLFSPFNFILLLFPNRLLPFGLLILIIIKSGLLGFSFQYMLTKLYGFKRESLVFSITYALMGYIIVYFQLYAYFDNMMLLPCLILGIHKIIENPKKKLMYIITLCLSIFINYYIGWMLCIFSVLYFCFQILLQTNHFKEIIEKKNIILSFLISSVIAGGIAAFSLIPSLLSLRGEKNSIHLGLYRTFSMTDLFSRLYTCSFKGNISSCLPNIYCGVLMIVFLVFYFFNSKVKMKEKILSGCFLLFMLLNFYINTLNIVWHGFNQPIGFPYRYSFLFTFLVLFFSFRGMINLDLSEYKKILFMICGLYLFYSIWILIKGSEVIGWKEVVLDAVILSFICTTFILYSFKKIKLSVCVLLFFFIQIFDLSINAVDAFHYFDLADMEDYQTYIDQVGSVIDQINTNDDSFFRLEKYFRRTHNDSMQFQYNGLTHYSSCEKKEIIQYMGNLGFRDNGNWSFYNSGSTAFVDSLFGVKYILSQYDSTGKPYHQYFHTDDEVYYVFQNPYALPLAFVSSKGNVNEEYHVDNPFEFQNEIANHINGKNNSLFEKADVINVQLNNVKESKENEYQIYEKIDSDQEASISYQIKINQENILEAYFDAPTTQNVNIFLNDEDMGVYFDKYKWDIMDFGKWNKDEVITVKIVLNDQSIKLKGSYFYYENYKNLDSWYQDVTSNQASIQKITSSHLIGNASTTEENCEIVFSFPYEKSWKVYVDGKETETKMENGALLSVHAKPGDHTIEMKYVPDGKWIGIIVSIIFLCVLVVVIIKEKYYILCYKKKFKELHKIN